MLINNVDLLSYKMLLIYDASSVEIHLRTEYLLLFIAVQYHSEGYAQLYLQSSSRLY